VTLDAAALLPGLRAIARAAGAVIMEHYAGAFDVRRKADRTPLTEADEASERLIVARLAELAPEIPTIAEEAAARGEEQGVDPDGIFFLVDPLDGTKEFVARNGEFAINIGLVAGRRPLAGVIFAPALDLMFSAAGTGTATMERGGGPPQPIHARPRPADGGIAITSRNHGSTGATAAMIEELGAAENRRMGSAIKFGLIAAGEADVYPRLGPTMEWDTAAGHAILNATGGRIETLSGQPLVYGKPGYRNPDFIAWGAPKA